MREICQKKGILRGGVRGRQVPSVWPAVSGRSLSGCGLLRISGISRAGSGRCCLCRRRREKDDDSGKGALPWSGAGHEEQVFYGFGSWEILRITAIPRWRLSAAGTATERL